MATATKKQTEIVDLMDHYELLLLFREYVDQCIEDYNHSSKPRPLSFDEWYVREYTPNIESLTQVICLQSSWYLAGSSGRGDFHCRIPTEIVSEDGGGIFDVDSLRRFAKKLADKNNHPETYVNYRGACVYRWSAD
jgi:hypothetical protein